MQKIQRIAMGIAFAMTAMLSASGLPAASTAFRLGGDPNLLQMYSRNPDSYPTCKSQVTYLHFDGNPTEAKRNLFDTNLALIEIGTYGQGREFTGNEVVERIRTYEDSGWTVAGVFVYRENWLRRREVGGPFPVDRRILSSNEVSAIRAAIANANPPLRCKETVKLIQLLGGRTWGQKGDSWLRMTGEMKEYLKRFDGVGTECHIGDHDPSILADGPNTLKAMASMTKWAQENGKVAFVFMGGSAATYKDLPKTRKTYQNLWAEIAAAGVDYKADHIIYFRQGARIGDQIPENDPGTLTHQLKWVIDSVDHRRPAISPIEDQTVDRNGKTAPILFTLGAELEPSRVE